MFGSVFFISVTHSWTPKTISLSLIVPETPAVSVFLNNHWCNLNFMRYFLNVECFQITPTKKKGANIRNRKRYTEQNPRKFWRTPNIQIKLCSLFIAKPELSLKRIVVPAEAGAKCLKYIYKKKGSFRTEIVGIGPLLIWDFSTSPLIASCLYCYVYLYFIFKNTKIWQSLYWAVFYKGLLPTREADMTDQN